MKVVTFINDFFGFPYMDECNNSEEFSTKIPKLLNKAKKEILITSMLSRDFYEKNEIKEAISNAIKREASIKIILDHKANNDNLPSWLIDEAKSGKIKIKKSKNNIPHSIVVDKENVRVEKEHEAEKWENATNIIAYNNAVEGLKWRCYFYGLWESDEVEEYST